MEWLLLVKLLCAHLLSDFLLQPNIWVESISKDKIRSKALYYHIGVTIITAALLTGFSDWIPVIIIGVTHYLIDLWKAYQPNNRANFFAQQSFYLIVIVGVFTWYSDNIWEYIVCEVTKLNNLQFWIKATLLISITLPASRLIGIIIEPWRLQIEDKDETLKNAGVWIGIFERLIIFYFVYSGEYEIIGWLLAAKSLRFNEKFEAKRTEYLLIGNLLSFGIAILMGLLAFYLP